MKPVRTWVLIADGGHAKVLESVGRGSGLEAQADMVFRVDLPRSHEILADRAVRSYESRGHARHAKGDSVDPHRELKRAFAKQLGKELLTKLGESRFDRLVLVAPPPALGDLRAALPKAVRATVVGELAQDLVKTPKARLWPHLAPVLGPEPAPPARRAAGKSR